ncbi:protein ripply1 [Diretmus argenteus]
MSSACLLLQQQQQQQQPSSLCSASPWSSRPLTASGHPDTDCSRPSLWRPWLASGRDVPSRRGKLSCPYSRPTVSGRLSSDGKPQAFQHPVRLFWPRSKSFDYLYSDGEALLRNFPIQATISFYEESDSEDEDEDDDWDEEGDSDECLKPQTHFTAYN